MTITEVTPEVLCDLEMPKNVRLSPDGKHVVYELATWWVKNKKHVTSSIWTADVGKENSSKQLTQGNYNDSAPEFSPDGKYISFLSDRAKPGKASALYLLPVDGGEALPLTSIENDAGINGYKWSPDSKSVAFISSDERTKEEKKKLEEDKDDVKVYGEDWRYGRLRIVDVRSKEVITLFSEDAHVTELAWNADGSKIAFTTSTTPELNDVICGTLTIRVVDVKTQKSFDVCTFPTLMHGLTWHRDELYWVGPCDGHHFQASQCVLKVAVKSDAKYTRYAFGVDSCADQIRRCGNELVVMENRGLSDRISFLDSKTLHEEECRFRTFDVVVNNDTAVVVIIKSDVSTPDEIFSIVNGKTCQVTQHNKDFAALKLGVTSTYKSSAEDGTPLDAVLCIPKSVAETPAKDRKPQKALVFLHGGPYDRTTVDFQLQLFNWCPWLLDQGYTLFFPNYRGGRGHGNDYAKAVRGNVDASYQDVVALVKKAVADGIIDEQRVGIGGWSQGGFLSYLAVTRDSDFHFQAAICGAGVTDWEGMAEGSDLPGFETDISGTEPWDCAMTDTHSRLSSPIYHMKDINTPVLIIHGEQDKRIPVAQAIGFHRGMMKHKKECEMAIYPREDHAIPPWERAHVIHMLKKLKSFLDKHIK